MSAIGFVMEKVRHGSELNSGELKLLADELDRLHSKIGALGQELMRREEADNTARQDDKRRAEELRVAKEAIKRLEDSLAFSRRQRSVESGATADKVILLEGILRDIHYGLLHQPEITREEIAGVIERIPITPHPKVEWGPDHPAYDEMGQ